MLTDRLFDVTPEVFTPEQLAPREPATLDDVLDRLNQIGGHVETAKTLIGWTCFFVFVVAAVTFLVVTGAIQFEVKPL